MMQASSTVQLLALIAAQVLCALFFSGDLIHDALSGGWAEFTKPHYLMEFLAVATLIASVAFEVRVLLHMQRKAARLEQQLALAAGAFHDIVIERFEAWGLTPSEQDVALFTLKGMAIPEIATLRGSAEGTVKAHLSGIYRKAGASGRGAFLSLFIEDLMTAPLPDAPGVPQTTTGGPPMPTGA